MPSAVSVGAGHAQRSEAPRGEIVDGINGGRCDLRSVRGQRQDDLRGALGDPERGAVGGCDGGFGAFVHRVEGLRSESHCMSFKTVASSSPPSTARSMGSSLSAREANAPSRITVAGCDALDRERGAQRE